MAESRPRRSGLVGKLVVFCVGVYLSLLYGYHYWYVGPIFGVVVLIWHVKSPRELVKLQHAAFVAASTLIYALVVWKYKPAIFGGPDNMAWVVAIGTILLPVAQTVFLRASWRRALIAIPGVYLTWFLVAFLYEKLSLTGSWIEPIMNPVVAWQSAYLVFMLAPRPKFGQ